VQYAAVVPGHRFRWNKGLPKHYDDLMDWRTWAAHDSEAKVRVRALPWHGRFRLTRIIIFALIATFIVLIVFNVVHAQPAKLSDRQIAEKRSFAMG
jgi:hypothetical protein